MTREISKAWINGNIEKVEVVAWYDEQNGIDSYEVKILEGKHVGKMAVAKLIEKIEYVKDLDLFEALEEHLRTKDNNN